MEMLEQVKGSTMQKAVRISQVVGIETVMYLRSLTDVMRPPVRKGEGPRQAHPGGWADVTGNLANAYGAEVQSFGDEVVLLLTNTMEYAAYLEARDAYYVLEGVAADGGPVQQLMERIVARVAPEIQVVHGGVG